MTHFKPKDIVAVFIIGVLALMKLKGIDNEFDTLVALIIGYYFAKRRNGEDNGK